MKQWFDSLPLQMKSVRKILEKGGMEKCDVLYKKLLAHMKKRWGRIMELIERSVELFHLRPDLGGDKFRTLS